MLLFAGLCECAFTFCLGKARGSAGLVHAGWLGGFAAFTILSMYLLMRASLRLPLGTAYTVWTGIGAVGTVLVGILYFHEPATFGRVFFLTTLVLSIIGLKMVSV